MGCQVCGEEWTRDFSGTSNAARVLLVQFHVVTAARERGSKICDDVSSTGMIALPRFIFYQDHNSVILNVCFGPLNESRRGPVSYVEPIFVFMRKEAAYSPEEFLLLQYRWGTLRHTKENQVLDLSAEYLPLRQNRE